MINLFVIIKCISYNTSLLLFYTVKVALLRLNLLQPSLVNETVHVLVCYWIMDEIL